MAGRMLTRVTCQGHFRKLFYMPQRLSSWKPFKLEDDLTVEVKKSIEAKWGDKVFGYGSPTEEQKRMAQRSCPDKSYILSMFPYPSGKLHLGHLRIYTLSDVLARYHRLKGEEVVHPIGWDAFGLPAENAARDNGVEPESWTRRNIDFMKEQLQRMGCSFDWDRELATCDPTYYKWTQWLFTKLWEHGLAYKKKAYVFWDPVDETVLAEEQVDSEMRSWRSGAKVEKRLLEQWYIRTSVFAKDLSDGLHGNSLRHGWRDIVDMQRNWIGPIQGYFTDCPILTTPQSDSAPGHEFLRLWFSSAEVLCSAQFAILNPTHYLNHSPENVLQSFPNGVHQMKQYIQNPTNGKALPIFSAPVTVLPTVPDSADCRVSETLSEEFGDLAANETEIKQIFQILNQSETYSGQQSEETKDFTYFPSSLKLRDWLISRQRKWGTPIPTFSCLDCGHNSIFSTNQLPISPVVINPKSNELPDCFCHDSTEKPTKTLCSKCGSSNVKQETDTLDTFFDSSWYFLRYLDPKNENQIFDPSNVAPWLPVRTYVGGKEHATLHLYYARFMSHFLHGLSMVPEKEPFKVLVPVGVVMGETLVSKAGKYLRSEEVTQEDNSKKFLEKATGERVNVCWEKMSKSKHNGIDPDGVLEEYGLDALRLLSMADVAPTSTRKWTSHSFHAYLKFQNKVWITVGDFVGAKESEEDIIQYIAEEDWDKMEAEIFDARNYHLKTITNCMESTSQISVAITKILGIITALRKVPKAAIKDSFEYERTLGTVLITLYPVMPAFCAQLWQYFRDVANLTETEFDLENEVWCQKWPEVDQHYKLDLDVVIRGEEVDTVKVRRSNLDNLDGTVALELALESDKVLQYVARESVQISGFKLEPGFKATLQLKDPNFAPPEKVKKATKTNKASIGKEKEVN